MSYYTYLGLIIKRLILITLLSSFTNLYAQSHHTEGTDEHGLHKITLGLGHVYFGDREKEIKNLVVSAYILNYDYSINKRWSIGTHNEIIIEDIRTFEGEEHTLVKENERPVITKLIGSYGVLKNTHLQFGVGDEITSHHNYFLLNLGLDYGIHFYEGWELGGELTFDNKWHGSDSWMFGIGISKLFGSHHKAKH